MLERILDNYHTKKLLKEVEWCFIVRDLDYKFEDDKYRVWVKAKPEKHDEKFYAVIMQIKKADAFKYMCDLENFLKQVRKIIEEYQRSI